MKADCTDEETISKVYENPTVKNFQKNHPEYQFELQGNREYFPEQCQYWFYNTGGIIQHNLWIIIEKEKNYDVSTKWMCFDHTGKEPLRLDPYDVPDLTSKNC